MDQPRVIQELPEFSGEEKEEPSALLKARARITEDEATALPYVILELPNQRKLKELTQQILTTAHPLPRKAKIMDSNT